ncbi:DUF3343 domain-containing protein [Acetobacterium fimetarium]|uniref:DUF3343 domain-containing protein n=1 Tax=Acetobacterium fimetarium TaxID=52691 RepID=A0ABR6WSR9_9FIRM|nr:DUF3343 domain-containing protein [Acetobacterium fimetarium]MBC3803674.1 DUF3343 domain-containing protein [Acetobacterium fimetarium]
MIYIATFYSHFGAIRFKKKCIADGLSASVMPVPRSLSSSCGTCVTFTVSDEYYLDENINEEIEQIVCVEENKYRQIYQASDS